jgi:NAD(P)-dependent dehydrogenase (short-subunit alcohol dehydrogenase family)
MVEQKYGRILMTTSSTGLYGNFGQSNYGAAKLALVGLMQTLGLEGAKHDIRVNCLAPTAATRMTEDLMPEEILAALQPQAVTPAMLVLVGQDAPTRTVLCAGAGNVEAAHITLTQGAWIGLDGQSPERLAEQMEQVRDRTGEMVPPNGSAQGGHEVGRAMVMLNPQ